MRQTQWTDQRGSRGFGKKLAANPHERFWYRLSLKLGGTVGELKARMTWREFLQWQAFYALEPWGEWLNDLRFAQLAFLLANIWRGKDTNPYPMKDFVFDWAGVIREVREEAQDDEATDHWEDRFIEGLERRMARQGALE